MAHPVHADEPAEDRRRLPLAPAAPMPRAEPSVAALAALQQSAGNQFVLRLLDAASLTNGQQLLRQVPAAEASAAGVNATPARKAIQAWEGRAEELLAATHEWQTANWIDYLGRTSSDPQLSFGDSELADIAANTLGNALTKIGDKVIRQVGDKSAAMIGAAIGTAVAPGAGTAIGFLLGVFIESAASTAFEKFTGAKDPGETAADAAERTAGFMQERHTLLSADYKKARAELTALIAAANDRVDQATSQSELDAIAQWAADEEAKSAQTPNTGEPYLMSMELLETWVLEHAGDSNSPRAGTDAEQWERALEHVKAGSLENQLHTFVHQTRAEWERAGLDHGMWSAEMMDEVSEVANAAYDAQEEPAFAVQDAFHNKELVIRGVSDAKKFTAYLVDHDMWGKLDANSVLSKAQAGEVTISCTLDVNALPTTAAFTPNTTWIDEWNWVVTFDAAVEEGDAGQPADPAAVPETFAFDVWPTWG